MFARAKIFARRMRAAVGDVFDFGPGLSGLEAGRFSRRLAGWTPSRSHVNTLIGASGKTVLGRARYLVRNNGYAAGAVECFANNLVGDGIKPSWVLSQKLSVERQAEIHTAFKRWTDAADAEGMTDYYGLQRRIARELFIAGECFVRIRPRYLRDGFFVPFQLELLPSEQLPTERNLWLANGNRVRQGIEFDKIGRRVSYHFWKVHPGDVTQSQNFGVITEVPAEQVMHIHDPLEAGQIRGLPKLTPAIVSLWLLDSYDDAELERKKTAALFSVFIERPDAAATFFNKALEDAAKAGGSSDVGINLVPGAAHTLLPGEKVEVAAPADVGQHYEAFQYRSLAKFCASVGLPYAGVTGDMVRANYGNQRAALVESRRRIGSLQNSVVIYQFCRPVVQAFLDYAHIGRALDLPGYATDPQIYFNVEHIPPKWDWVDPLKDMQAEVIAVNAGFKARSRVVEAQGLDPVEEDNRIAADKEREKKLGLTFTGTEGIKQEIAAPPAADPHAKPEDGEPPAHAAYDGARLNGHLPGPAMPGNGHESADEFAGVLAAIAAARALPAPVVNVTVPITMPKKSAEVTTVTKHDAAGRILEVVRSSRDDDEPHLAH